MKLLPHLLAGLLLGAASTTAVHADTFNFSFTGNSSVIGVPGLPFSGSGQMFATEIGTTNVFHVTNITGTTMSSTIASLLPAGGFLLNDNLLFFTPGAASATMDNFGISYQLSSGVLANLFRPSSGSNSEVLLGLANGMVVAETQTARISVTPASSPVPEPGTLALLGTGVVGFAGMVRRGFAA